MQAAQSSTGPDGVSARMRTSGASVSASRPKSRSVTAATNLAPRSVAEGRRADITDSLPEGCRAAELPVRDELTLVQLAGAEADGKGEQASAVVGGLLDEPGERRQPSDATVSA